MVKFEPKTKKEQTKLHEEVLEKIIGLFVAAIGLVAALAWNEAIKALFIEIFPERSGLVALFGYAAIITIIAVIVTLQLSRLLRAVKRDVEKEEKKEEKREEQKK